MIFTTHSHTFAVKKPTPNTYLLIIKHLSTSIMPASNHPQARTLGHLDAPDLEYRQELAQFRNDITMTPMNTPSTVLGGNAAAWCDEWLNPWIPHDLEWERNQHNIILGDIDIRERANSIPATPRLIPTKLRDLEALDKLPLLTPKTAPLGPVDCNSHVKLHCDDLSDSKVASTDRRRQLDTADPLYRYPGEAIRRLCGGFSDIKDLDSQYESPLETISEIIAAAEAYAKVLALEKKEEASHFDRTPFVVRHFPTKKIMF